jgi:putative flippase GtrA
LVVGATGFLVQILLQELSIRSGFTTIFAAVLDTFMNIHHTNLNPLSQSIGAGIGAEAAILSNFFLNNYWTFQDTRSMKHRTHGVIRLTKFNATSLLSIIIQSLSVWVGIKLFTDNIHIM